MQSLQAHLHRYFSSCLGLSYFDVLWMFYLSFDNVSEAVSQVVTPLLPSACCNQIKTPLFTEERRRELTCLFLCEGKELPPHYFF